jgi:AcrR family transcriptional regulator
MHSQTAKTKIDKGSLSTGEHGAKPRPIKNRRQEIAAKAAEFFAEFGFDASTRDFAKYLGTTQPLIYRYFATKEALIEEVYKIVYLQLWDEGWDKILENSKLPLRTRLIEFYNKYTDAIMNSRWMRLYLFAGLKGVKINENYLKLVEERIIKRIIIEFWKDRKYPRKRTIDQEDIEVVYNLHCGIFYFGIRRFVYHVPVLLTKDKMIMNAIDIFLDGYDAMLKRRMRKE